jgi:hypothetical protein
VRREKCQNKVRLVTAKAVFVVTLTVEKEDFFFVNPFLEGLLDGHLMGSGAVVDRGLWWVDARNLLVHQSGRQVGYPPPVSCSLIFHFLYS